MSLLQINRFKANSRTNSRWLTMLAIRLGLSLLLALVPLGPSAAVSVSQVPNPQQSDGLWVTDMANMLSDRTEADLNQMISALEATNSAEIAVVTVPDTQGASSPKAFATELFNTWGIGKEGTDNGVLFLVSKGDRRNEIETGYGVEGILPDAKLGAILNQQVTPQFKAGNFDAGILQGTEAIVIALGGEGLPSGSSTPPPGQASPTNPAATPYRHTPASKPDSYTSFPDGSGNGFSLNRKTLNVLKLLLVGAIAPAVIAIKPLTTGKFKTLKLSPSGRTKLSYVEGSGWYSWAMAWADVKLSARDFNKFKHLFRADTYPSMMALKAKRSSWLTLHHRNKQFNLTATVLFVLLLSLSFAALRLEGHAIFVAPAIAWCWLAGELATYHHSKSQSTTEATTKTLTSLSIISIGALIAWAPFRIFLTQLSLMALLTMFLAVFVSAGVVLQLAQAASGWRRLFLACLGIVSPLCVVFFGWDLLASPFIPTIIFGLLAGLTKLLRASQTLRTAACATCTQPLKPMSTAQLKPHLTKPEQAETKIGSKAYEGWCCPICSGSLPASSSGSSSNTSPGSLSVHLVEFVLNKKQFKTCKTCKSLTVTIRSNITRQPTYSSSGRKCITKLCHACLERSERTVTIPSKSASSSSSSYSSSSSSSSSSSGSSSSGSFGGGSSGGGGAGSSW